MHRGNFCESSTNPCRGPHTLTDMFLFFIGLGALLRSRYFRYSCTSLLKLCRAEAEREKCTFTSYTYLVYVMFPTFTNFPMNPTLLICIVWYYWYCCLIFFCWSLTRRDIGMAISASMSISWPLLKQLANLLLPFGGGQFITVATLAILVAQSPPN